MVEDKKEDKVVFSDKLDILKYASDIQLDIKDSIKSDFVLAKLEEVDKVGIINNTGNAYYSLELIKQLKKKTKWVWKDDKYVEGPLDKEQLAMLDLIAKKIFNSFMNKIYMTVILNRNVDKNHILQMLTGHVEESTEEDDAKEKIAKLLEDRKKVEK